MKKAIIEKVIHAAAGSIGSKIGSDSYSRIKSMSRKCRLCTLPRAKKLPLCEEHIKEYATNHFTDESVDQWTSRIKPKQPLGYGTLVILLKPLKFAHRKVRNTREVISKAWQEGDQNNE